MKTLKTYRDLTFTQVQKFADKNNLNIDGEENYREAAIALFDLKNKVKKTKVSNKIQHTPGPWKITNPNFEYLDIDSEKGQICSLFKGIDSTADISEDEAIANSKLIVSAPELLNALTALIDRLNYHGNIDTIREEGPINDAINAINKATGK